MFDLLPRTLTQTTTTSFSADQDGLYALFITARCTAAQHSVSHNDEMLRIEIDGHKIGAVLQKKRWQYNKIPPTWNGTQLNGLATIEKQAEYGKHRPWYTFAFLQLPLRSVMADVSVGWHPWHGDGVKMAVDAATEQYEYLLTGNDLFWFASPLQRVLGERREQKTITFTGDSSPAVHYIEFWADRTPVLHQVNVELGKFDFKPLLPVPSPTPNPSSNPSSKHKHHIPTVDNPKWTGDFADDTDQMLLARLIFGEGRNQSKEVMEGITWTVKNRLLAKHSYFGLSYHKIILKHSKGIYQFSSLNPNDSNFQRLIDPLENNNAIEKTAWINAYEIAGGLFDGTFSDPTQGAVYFHSDDHSAERFVTRDVPGAVFVKRIGRFLFYRGPK